MIEELSHVGLVPDRKKGYIENVHCSNCNWRKTIYIPFKVKIKDYLIDKCCERCKCIGVLY